MNPVTRAYLIHMFAFNAATVGCIIGCVIGIVIITPSFSDDDWTSLAVYVSAYGILGGMMAIGSLFIARSNLRLIEAGKSDWHIQKVRVRSALTPADDLTPVTDRIRKNGWHLCGRKAFAHHLRLYGTTDHGDAFRGGFHLFTVDVKDTNEIEYRLYPLSRWHWIVLNKGEQRRRLRQVALPPL